MNDIDLRNSIKSKLASNKMYFKFELLFLIALVFAFILLHFLESLDPLLYKKVYGKEMITGLITLNLIFLLPSFFVSVNDYLASYRTLKSKTTLLTILFLFLVNLAATSLDFYVTNDIIDLRPSYFPVSSKIQIVIYDILFVGLTVCLMVFYKSFQTAILLKKNQKNINRFLASEPVLDIRKDFFHNLDKRLDFYGIGHFVYPILVGSILIYITYIITSSAPFFITMAHNQHDSFYTSQPNKKLCNNPIYQNDFYYKINSRELICRLKNSTRFVKIDLRSNNKINKLENSINGN